MTKKIIPYYTKQQEDAEHLLSFVDKLTTRATVFLLIFAVIYFGTHILIALNSGRF